jgi:hypothetical protein
MKKIQLQKFTDFANQLLPHETAYLMSVQQFEDAQKLEILRLVDYNCRHIGQFSPYDTSIDKRKYSHLKNWIQDRLEEIDVDAHYKWMLELEKKIMTDAIDWTDEKALLKAVRTYRHPGFFFSKFFELLQLYRHFLLIRLRYSDYEVVHGFLEQYATAYTFSRETGDRLHRATNDIVRQYSGGASTSAKWESWLQEVFYNEQVEGIQRHMALIRLTFISFNYRKYDLLREKYDYLDRQLREGKYYSKRLLVNYYINRLLLHSSFGEYDQAAFFGYLSIREKTHDYILYVNNLCSVLLKLEKHQQALELMRQAAPEMRNTQNMFNRVSFVAYYMGALNKNGLHKNAEGYGDTFLKAYAKEILSQRWHLFFSHYLEALLYQGQYEKIIKAIRKHELLVKDQSHRNKAGYQPNIPAIYHLSQYKEGNIAAEEAKTTLQEVVGRHQASSLMQLIRRLAPEIV